MTLSGDFIRRVDHAAEEDRAIMRQVYEWGLRDPAIYLNGSGYRDADDFIDPPYGSLEYLAFLDDAPAALLTLIPFVTIRKVYQVGLIADPDASLRKICKLLRGFQGAVFGAFADALFVELPERPEFSPTRKLASFFGLRRISQTGFLLLKSEYGNQEKERDDHRLLRRLQVVRPDAGGRGARQLHA